MKTFQNKLTTLNNFTHLFNFFPYKEAQFEKLKRIRITAYCFALSAGLVSSGFLFFPLEEKHIVLLNKDKSEALLFAELEALNEEIRLKEINTSKHFSENKIKQSLKHGRRDLIKLLQSLADADDQAISIEAFEWGEQKADIYCYAQTPEAIEIWLSLVESKLPDLVIAKVYGIERNQKSKEYPYQFKASFAFKIN